MDYENNVVEQQVEGGNSNLDNLGGEILKWGIMAIVFGACTFCLAFLGIVFGSKTSKLVKEYEAVAPVEGRAKVGQILGKIGFIVGIVMTVIFALYVAIFGCAACMGVMSY